MAEDCQKKSTQKHQTTVFVLDFDDTLLPYTSLYSEGIGLHDREIWESCKGSQSILSKEKETWYTEKWDVLEQQLISSLKIFLELSPLVHIVTAGEENWVDFSCAKFYPNLWCFIRKHNIKIYSARTLYEKQYPDNYVEWKSAVIRSILREYNTDPATCQIVSIGDSYVERNATIKVADEMNYQRKSIKMIEKPNLDRMLVQWKLLSYMIPKLYTHEGNLDLMMVVQ